MGSQYVSIKEFGWYKVVFREQQISLEIIPSQYNIIYIYWFINLPLSKLGFLPEMFFLTFYACVGKMTVWDTKELLFPAVLFLA